MTPLSVKYRHKACLQADFEIAAVQPTLIAPINRRPATMQPTVYASNPFAMLLDPEGVLARVAHSERLARLQSRICRPLDKPLLPGAAASTEDLAAFDGAIDEAQEESTEEVTLDNSLAALPAMAPSTPDMQHP